MRGVKESLRGISEGWRNVATIARYVRDGGRLVNRYSEELDFWGGLGWWWVESEMLGPPRELGRDLERLFGSEAPSVLTDSDSGGNPFTNSGLLSSYNHDFITGKSTPLLSIGSTAQSAGAWKWNEITIHLPRSPHPIRRMLISAILGAKWIEFSKKRSEGQGRYLRLIPRITSPTPSCSSSCTSAFTSFTVGTNSS